jgi:hypothetical protein
MRMVAPQLGALERIDFVHLLDQPGPAGLASKAGTWRSSR